MCVCGADVTSHSALVAFHDAQAAAAAQHAAAHVALLEQCLEQARTFDGVTGAEAEAASPLPLKANEPGRPRNWGGEPSSGIFSPRDFGAAPSTRKLP